MPRTEEAEHRAAFYINVGVSPAGLVTTRHEPMKWPGNGNLKSGSSKTQTGTTSRTGALLEARLFS